MERGRAERADGLGDDEGRSGDFDAVEMAFGDGNGERGVGGADGKGEGGCG